METIWARECYGGYDKEDGKTYYTQPFGDWYSPPEGIAPVDSNGETDTYRLIVSLNDLGRAFMLLDGFLVLDDPIESRIFPFDSFIESLKHITDK